MVLAVSPGWSQSPIGSDLVISDQVAGYPVHAGGQLVALTNGAWRTLWTEQPNQYVVEPPFDEFRSSREVSPSGELGPVQRLLHAIVPDTQFGDVFLTHGDPLHFAILFRQQRGNPDAFHGNFYDLEGRRTGSFRSLLPFGIAAVVPRIGGLWTTLGFLNGPFFWEVMNAQGQQILGPQTLDPGYPSGPCGYGFAATPEGDGAVTWSVYANPALKTEDVRARFFTASGELGPEFQVNPHSGTAVCPEIAMLPGGREAWVLYRDAESFFPPRDGLHVQRVTSAGQRIGREITVSTGPDAARIVRKIASDRFGNFVVVWSQLAFAPDYCGVAGRLYRADGRPVGGTFPFANVPYECGDNPQVAFADNGTLAAVWEVSPNSAKADIHFARFSASPADEPCLARAGHLLCDTGRTGGAPEIDLEVSADPSAVLLMGDVDGDGRADPCVVDGSHLRCDLDHRGALLDWEGDFPAGDDGTGIPLLGDVDGDGKADLCLWRRGTLRCRTGSGPWKESFGRAGGVPLLGDVDGDGRADLCVRRGNQFLCDTAHDGGRHEIRIAFGLPTDVPLLGDFDGDGRADPCVLRGSQLLCDTKHNGGIGEGQLTLAVQPGDRPLLANLDGL
jgi:hypothetical protein